MSVIEDWIDKLSDGVNAFAGCHLEDRDCGELAVLLQERLDVAEELYNVNAQLSISLMHDKGLTPAQVTNLNFSLAALIIIFNKTINS